MRYFQIILFLIATIIAESATAQTALLRGRIFSDKGEPLQGATIQLLGFDKGTTTNDQGYFEFSTRANRAFALVFSFSGFVSQQKNFYLNTDETEEIVVVLVPGKSELQPVEVNPRKNRQEMGLITINPKLVRLNPAPIAGVENMIKVLIGSNNELSSQYTVRGGNYDENLVYVNDFEIYRPYLVRSGQQEGLSFINPDLVKQVNFYNGGFQTKYGDRMSSVLDVEYKRPSLSSGGAYIGLLEQGLHLEGSSANKRFSYLAGVRNRSLRNLLSSQETKGNYLPSSADAQALLVWKPTVKWELSFFGNLSQTRFDLEPKESRQTTSVFTPFYQLNLGLDIDFYGRESDNYKTRFAGITSIYTASKQFKWKTLVSYLKNTESENINIGGSYLFGDREFDPSSPDFGQIVNPLGAGEFLQYARNQLEIDITQATVQFIIDKKNHYLQIGQTLEHSRIADRLDEFEYQDSIGYSLPNNPGPLALSKVINSQANIGITRLQGFIQDNLKFEHLPGVSVQAGLRYNFNFLNNEWLISPRVNLSYAPKKTKQDIILRLSGGAYHQPPFYREMRKPDGSINTNLKAQQSWQTSAGFDYLFRMVDRPFRLNGEVYYKHLTRVVPYDIDNVRLRYFGTNNAKAKVYGAEMRLFGELIKDAESWLSIGFMKARENIEGDFYQNYLNKDGEVIGLQTEDKVVVDSQQVNLGWLRRPTDRRVTVGIFFSDYLTTNKNFKTYLQLLYGSNLPYNIPGSTRYRNAMQIPAYLRTDIGFTYRLVGGDRSLRRSHDPFRGFQDIWISAEIFNLLDRSNTISFTLIKDFANNTYNIPNRLTPRLLNFKITANW